MKNILTVAMMAFLFLTFGLGCDDKSDDNSPTPVEQTAQDVVESEADVVTSSDAEGAAEVSDTATQTEADPGEDSADTSSGDTKTAETDSGQ